MEEGGPGGVREPSWELGVSQGVGEGWSHTHTHTRQGLGAGWLSTSSRYQHSRGLGLSQLGGFLEIRHAEDCLGLESFQCLLS